MNIHFFLIIFIFTIIYFYQCILFLETLFQTLFQTFDFISEVNFTIES